MEKEIFKDIKGYEGLYQISNLGSIKSLSRINKNGYGYFKTKEKLLKTNPNIVGYPVVNLKLNKKSTTYTIHRLLAIHFIDNPENKQTVNHINGIKSDNRLENLEWSTQSENIKHAYDIGLNYNKGEKHANSKLKDFQVNQIREMLNRQVMVKDIANIFNVHVMTISDIKTCKTWKNDIQKNPQKFGIK
jgi:hypothetical protein